jgi:hypothetical protein
VQVLVALSAVLVALLCLVQRTCPPGGAAEAAFLDPSF